MNILIIKPGAIGDLLQLSPVIRALKTHLPQARITMLVANTASIDLFRHNPLVDEIMVYDKRGTHRSLAAFAGLWLDLRRRRFDVVVNYQRSNLKAWLLSLAAFPCRILVYHRARNRSVHAVENHLEALVPLGINPRTAAKRLELFLDAADEQWADEVLAREGVAGRPLVALNLGASHPVNRWPVEYFADLATSLSQQLGVAVVFVGGGGDRELIDRARPFLTTPVVDLVGRTSLLQLGALLKRCSLLVSGDTGPMHLATAVGTTVVALFGAADPLRTGPVGDGHLVLQAKDVACVPCRSRVCRHEPCLECMTALTVATVLKEVSVILGEKKL